MDGHPAVLPYPEVMIVDTSAPASRPSPERLREWLANQRVFISSAMADTALERREVARTVEDEGATPLWFEEFGRDSDPERAYLEEVDRCTVYMAICNELYGRLLADGFSATEAEFERARDGGTRLAAYTAGIAPGREGHLTRFIDRIRSRAVTETYSDTEDLSRRVRRRLHELAGEALSPWVKVGSLVFRADEIEDAGDTITVRTRASDDIAHRLEALREGAAFGGGLRIVYTDRVREANLTTARRTVRAVGSSETMLSFEGVRAAVGNVMRAGTGRWAPDDLVELGLRRLFLGESLPDTVESLGFMTEPGVDGDDLAQAFALSNEIAPAIARLVVTEGLVGGGRAERLTRFELGPRAVDTRRVLVEWRPPQAQTNVESPVRNLEGDWTLQ